VFVHRLVLGFLGFWHIAPLFTYDDGELLGLAMRVSPQELLLADLHELEETTHRLFGGVRVLDLLDLFNLAIWETSQLILAWVRLLLSLLFLLVSYPVLLSLCFIRNLLSWCQLVPGISSLDSGLLHGDRRI